jgi:hypothetical protein
MGIWHAIFPLQLDTDIHIGCIPLPITELKTMFRIALAPLALLSSAALAAGPYYSAEPATAPSQQRFVARENVWRCRDLGCTSARSASRPEIVCATLVRQVGPLRSFSVDGRAFGAEELESCNSRAR